MMLDRYDVAWPRRTPERTARSFRKSGTGVPFVRRGQLGPSSSCRGGSRGRLRPMTVTEAPRFPGDDLTVPAVPVPALLDGAARRFGDRAAFVHGDRSLSFADLWRHACGFAHLLAARGVEPGQAVGLHLPNCLAFPVAYYGTLLAGAVFAPASPALGPAELAAQLADAGARAVVTRDPFLAGALVTGGVDLLADLRGAPADAPPELDIDPTVAVAHLAYTGGTTGRPKGVVLTHRNVVANVVQYSAMGGSRAVPDVGGAVTLEQVSPPEEHPTRLGEGVVLAVAPWFHAMGTGGMSIGLVAGATAVVQERFDPARYLADVERHRATTLTGAPAMYHALLAHPDATTRDLTSVRTVTSGAAPMPVALAERIVARMPDAVLTEGYGLTEATMGLALTPSARSAHRRLGTVGLPVPGTEIVLLPVDAGRPGDAPVAVGAPGEVWARGPQIMVGYHGRPEETAAVLIDGWLRTGDIGVVGADGHLAIVDRAKDMVIYKGYNVFPRELEERLAAHPAVRQAAVLGLPDAAVGELPVAVLVGVDIDAVPGVVEDVNAAVRPYERLRRAYVVDALPVSAAGKVRTRVLRDSLAEPVWTDDRPPS